MTKKLKLGNTARVVPMTQSVWLASWMSDALYEDMRDQSQWDLTSPACAIMRECDVAKAQEIAKEDWVAMEFDPEETPPETTWVQKLDDPELKQFELVRTDSLSRHKFWGTRYTLLILSISKRHLI